MLPSSNILTVQPVGAAAALAPHVGVGDARQEAFERSLQTMVGKSMQAAILSKFSDGSFLVKVAGTAARMMLPAGAQVGTEVPMTLVAASPRPTFQLATANGPALQAALAYPDPGAALADDLAQAAARSAPGIAYRALGPAATLLARAPLTPASQLPGLDSDTPSAQLSSAARMLTTVLNTAHGGPGAILGATPLIAGGIPDPAQLARKLQQAVSTSGLFYESHLAEWAEGKRALPELMREPQMQRALGANAAATDPATAHLVDLQLASHEQARVAWQGQLGPGQPLQWEINKDAPEGRRGESEAEPAWNSALRLRFALLGEIAANVVMVGDQLHIQLQAGSGEVGGLLRAHAAGLSEALASAGTPLSSLNISEQKAARDG